MAGSCYVFVLLDARGEPISLTRQHPATVRVLANRYGAPVAYEVGAEFGQSATFKPLAELVRLRERSTGGILHIRRPSLDRDGQVVFGTGLLEPMQESLRADLASTERARISSETGRPVALLSSKVPLTPDQVVKASDRFEETFKRRHGGVVTLGADWELKPLSWTPKDMQLHEMSAATRSDIMAATGVTPVLMGFETANYATAQQQATVSWTQFASAAARLAEGLSLLGLCYAQPVELRIDTSGIAALQVSRSEQVARIGQHIANGMLPAAAYALEGLPQPEEAFAPPAAPPAPPASPTSPTSDEEPDGDEQAEDVRDAAEELLQLLEDVELPEEAAAAAQQLADALEPQ